MLDSRVFSSWVLSPFFCSPCQCRFTDAFFFWLSRMFTCNFSRSHAWDHQITWYVGFFISPDIAVLTQTTYQCNFSVQAVATLERPFFLWQFHALVPYILNSVAFVAIKNIAFANLCFACLCEEKHGFKWEEPQGMSSQVTAYFLLLRLI